MRILTVLLGLLVLAQAAEAAPAHGAPPVGDYRLRRATRGDYVEIKRLMAADQGRPFSDEDLSAKRHELEEDPEVHFYVFEDGGEVVGFISVHVKEVVTFRGYYFEPGKKDLRILVLRLAELLDRLGKDGRITVCPPYLGILPVLETHLGDRATITKMTDAGDWVAVTIRHQPRARGQDHADADRSGD